MLDFFVLRYDLFWKNEGSWENSTRFNLLACTWSAVTLHCFTSMSRGPFHFHNIQKLPPRQSFSLAWKQSFFINYSKPLVTSDSPESGFSFVMADMFNQPDYSGKLNRVSGRFHNSGCPHNVFSWFVRTVSKSHTRGGANSRESHISVLLQESELNWTEQNLWIADYVHP